MFSELHAKSHYTFLAAASSPQELVRQAAELGYTAIAITDECSYAGLVKAYQASASCGIKLIVGSEFSIDADDSVIKLILLASNRSAYSEISALITKGRRRSPKGEYALKIKDLQFGLRHCLAIWLPNDCTSDEKNAKQLSRYFRERLWIGVELFRHSKDQNHYLYCHDISKRLNLNMVACNDVLIHKKCRKPLLDTVTAIRLGTSVQALGKRAQSNAEHYLKPISVLQSQYPQALLNETRVIADKCHFTMDELRYEYPKELVPDETSPSGYLRQLTEQGAAKRWPQGTPSAVRKQIEHELALIQELQYEYYFLTVYDIVAFAQTQNILCQGRGSAANSAVCYCLYITEVNPDEHKLLFERFISKERNEPPDIDVDFESQRREEVIQYIYRKYSRKRTAIAATVVTYRRKSAVREVAKALGLPVSFADELNRSLAWWDRVDVLTEKMKDFKLSFDQQLTVVFIKLVREIMGTPRHLSQHVGGFIITHSPTSTLVPIENAAMPDRTIIQWDKYDIEILGLLKVDILGLGMLTAIRRALDMVSEHQGQAIGVEHIPHADPKVYEVLCRGDSIGLFQVESRAQMSMLPRLKPKNFYDLVIQVAIVRPGPIQGGMVHPYLKRRDGLEKATYPNQAIKEVLGRTLGIPIFQEQVIELTMVAAGFSGGEADQLRRAMGSFNKNGDLTVFRDKLRLGMVANGYSEEYAERLYKQIEGFGSYGFPESHSASFALLVYFSAWLKLYHPAVFYIALLNSQPMGFYSPAQLIQDARRHKIRVLPVCINNSSWDHALDFTESTMGIRLGFRLIKSVLEKSALKIEKSLKNKGFESISDVKQRQLMSNRELTKLVSANAFSSFEQNRRQVYWQSLSKLDGLPISESARGNTSLKPLSPIETMLADYQHARGVSLKYHPMQLVRNIKPFSLCTPADQLLQKANMSLIQVSGLVTGRQRPGTASGVLFMTLEDETGNINVVIWKAIQERFRQQILSGKILHIKGRLEHKHGVSNIIAGYIEDQSDVISAIQVNAKHFSYQ